MNNPKFLEQPIIEVDLLIDRANGFMSSRDSKIDEDEIKRQIIMFINQCIVFDDNLNTELDDEHGWDNIKRIITVVKEAAGIQFKNTKKIYDSLQKKSDISKHLEKVKDFEDLKKENVDRIIKNMGSLSKTNSEDIGELLLKQDDLNCILNEIKKLDFINLSILIGAINGSLASIKIFLINLQNYFEFNFNNIENPNEEYRLSLGEKSEKEVINKLKILKLDGEKILKRVIKVSKKYTAVSKADIGFDLIAKVEKDILFYYDHFFQWDKNIIHFLNTMDIETNRIELAIDYICEEIYSNFRHKQPLFSSDELAELGNTYIKKFKNSLKKTKDINSINQKLKSMIKEENISISNENYKLFNYILDHICFCLKNKRKFNLESEFEILPNIIEKMISIRLDILEHGIGLIDPSLKLEILEKKMVEKELNIIQLKHSQGFDWARKVAHEIGGPIEIIHDNVDLIKNYFKEKELLKNPIIQTRKKKGHTIEKTIQITDESIKVINNIVTGIKNKGQLTPPKPILLKKGEIQELISNLFDNHQRGEKGISLNIDQIDVELYIDKNQFIQILTNLFENSIKYGFNGFEGKKEVSISVKGQNEDTIFIYANTGNPVKCTEKDYWDQFQTIDKQKGSGLGMSIVKEIVSNHGGTTALDPESFKFGHKLKLKFPKKLEKSNEPR